MPQFPAVIDLASLNGSNGFRLSGVAAGDRSGFSVSSAGDVNGDGFDDVIVGAQHPYSSSGESYVIFGKASGFASALDPADLDGSNGFMLNGIDSGDLSGVVSAAGDVNGDGFGDILIGAPGADGGAGESYVVFGIKPTDPVNRTGTVADQTLAGGLGADTLSALAGDGTGAGAAVAIARLLNGGAPVGTLARADFDIVA